MPFETQPEDLPAAVRFRLEQKDGSLQVTVATLQQQTTTPYRIQENVVEFESSDAFKARVVEVGMSPAVAEDQGRSFNATARQLLGLGFSVELPGDKEEQHEKAA